MQCCAGDQSAVHVQSADGSAISAIDSPEALDAALAGCNRKGNRERALQNALKRDQSKLRGSLQAGQTRGVRGQSQVPPSVAGEVNSADRQTIQVTHLGSCKLFTELLHQRHDMQHMLRLAVPWLSYLPPVMHSLWRIQQPVLCCAACSRSLRRH